MTKLDALTMKADGTVALLVGVEPRIDVLEFQARLKEFVGFALDGQMVREYPDTAGHPVEIILVFPGEPTDATYDLLGQFGAWLNGFGVAMSVQVQA